MIDRLTNVTVPCPVANIMPRATALALLYF